MIRTRPNRVYERRAATSAVHPFRPLRHQLQLDLDQCWQERTDRSSPKYAARTCAADSDIAEGAHAPPNHSKPSRTYCLSSAVPWRASLRRAWCGRLRSGCAKAGVRMGRAVAGAHQRSRQTRLRLGRLRGSVRGGAESVRCIGDPQLRTGVGRRRCKSVDEAKFAALKNCQKHADKCVIRESKCNKWAAATQAMCN
jgi:hypothetical protein